MVLLSIPEDKHREGAHASGAIREDQSIGERLAALRVQSLKARAKNAGAIHSGASPRTRLAAIRHHVVSDRNVTKRSRSRRKRTQCAVSDVTKRNPSRRKRAK